MLSFHRVYTPVLDHCSPRRRTTLTRSTGEISVTFRGKVIVAKIFLTLLARTIKTVVAKVVEGT